MRSSRSKRLGLNLVADDDPRYSRSPENSLPKSYGGFSSFFGRSKRGKSPVQSIRIGSPDPTVDDHTVTLPDPQVVRTSLTLDRYRTMSHSMSDLSAVISRTDPAIAQFSVTAPLETLRSDLATDLSPTKRSSTKDNENLDFSDSSIAKHGWLNKKVTKKETNMKLHKVFVGQGDDFLHNSTDISRAFDLEVPSATPVEETSDPLARNSENVVHPDDFDPDVRNVLFDFSQSTVVRLFSLSLSVRELSASTQIQTDYSYLLLILASKLIICRKKVQFRQNGSLQVLRDQVDSAEVQATQMSPSSSWSLNADLELSSLEFFPDRSDLGDIMEIRSRDVSRKFVGSSGTSVRTFLNRCFVQKRNLRTDIGLLTESSDVPGVANEQAPQLNHRGTDAPVDPLQLNIDGNGRLISGTVPGLVRRLLVGPLEISESAESLTDTLLHTVGLWTSAEAFVSEMNVQLASLSSVIPKSRPGQIIRILLDTATSLLLDSKTVEALLTLIKFTENHESETLREVLWAKRAHLLNVISMDHSCPSNSASAIPESSRAAEYQSLSHSGLQSESILAIPADLLATQLHIFHQYYLEHWNPAKDKSLFFSCEHRGASRNPLVFSHHKMHFLTATILSHILCIDTRPISSKKRAAICTQWILIGIISKRAGDMTGWLATVMALCAPSVVRLKEMWSLVEDRLRLIVEKEWSPVMRDLFRRSVGTVRAEELSAHVLAPDAAGQQALIANAVPFYGDLCDAIEGLRKAVLDHNQGRLLIDLTAVSAAKNILGTALDSYQMFLMDSGDATRENEYVNSPVITAFQDCFKQLNSMPYDTLQVCSPVFLMASSKCESVRLDDLSTRKDAYVSGLGTSAFMPLLFIDQLPCYRLFDATDLLDMTEYHKRPKLQSTTSSIRSSQAPISGTPLRRLNSFPPTQRPARYTTGHILLDDITRARTAASVSQWKMLRHVRDLTGVTDQLLTFASGNLILKDSEEEDSSTKRRRPHSVLVEARKRDSTISRRSSINLVDVLPTEIDDDLVIKPFKMTTRRKGTRELVIKAGTLDVLVDLLIFNINDAIGLGIIEQGDNRLASRNIELDRPEFIKVFLLSHRSYCTSVNLLDSLSTRLKKAITTSTVYIEDDDSNLPGWSELSAQTDGEINWSLAEKIVTGISEVVSTWLNLAPGTFTDTSSISESLDNFLRISEALLVRIQSFSEEGTAAYVCGDLYSSHLKRIHKQVLRARHRPQSWSLVNGPQDTWTNYESVPVSRLSTTSDICDAIKSLDWVVECVLQAISMEDWMACYEILELQAIDSRGFLRSNTEQIHLDQEVEIRDSLWLLENTLNEDTQNTLLDSMPLPIRKLVDLRTNIKSWTIAQLTDPSLTLDSRVKRAQIFLRILEISGICMSSFDIQFQTVPGNVTKTQIVPSFIAGAVAAGLVAPQSRLFSLCWSTVAEAAGKEGHTTNLFNLVPRDAEVPEPHLPLVSCSAWLVDRMLEIACYIPDKLVDNSRLINLDKRRYIYNLLTNLDLAGAGLTSSNARSQDYANNPFLFLLATPKKDPDWRSLRSTAYRENQGSRNTRMQRPFMQLVQQEQEKVRRDMRCRDAIDKQQRDLQKIALRKRQETTRTFESSKRPAARSRYGMNSLLKAVRPISVAIAGNWAPERHSSMARVVSPIDLPAQCNIPRGCKPALTIDLVNAVTNVANSNENLFKIRTEDGLETFFQATSPHDMNDWVRVLSLASVDGARKRRTIIREDARLAATEDTPEFSPRNSMVVNHNTAIFGVDLAVLVRRESSSVPKIAVLLLDEIEDRGLHDTGIYRISGSLSTVNSLKKAFDSGLPVDLSGPLGNDINAIAGVFKLWLRELPEPLMTYALYDAFLATLEIEDHTTKSLTLKSLVHKLPVPNFSMLKKLIQHLEKVTDYESTNHMYAHNLAIVFGPNVLQPIPSSVSLASSMNDLGKVQTLIRNLILECHWIFSTDDEIEDPGSLVRTAPEGGLPPIGELA